MGTEQRRRALLAAIVVLVGTGIGTVAAQEGPAAPPATEPAPTTTTVPSGWWLPALTATTAPPPTSATTTTAPPEVTTTTAPAGTGEATTTTAPPEVTTTTAPPADDGDGGDGAGGVIPAEAQRIMRSIPRTAPNDNHALVEGAAALEATGVPHDEAVREVFGSFPVLGPTHWSDDWYTPRWTGTTFRYHLGLDMLAPYGTPVAAPADGTVRVSNSALGGLAIYVTQADGTAYYLAHLSGIADGMANGVTVALGQIVGYVGNSGNARGGPAHVHFAIRPGGGEPVPPKPIVDQWVADGAARAALLLSPGSAPAAPVPAAIVASGLTRQWADGVAAGADGAASPPRSELLWASAASPNGGAVAVADAAAASLNESVDWEQRAAELRSRQQAWSQSSDQAWQLVGPLMNPALRQAVEDRR